MSGLMTPVVLAAGEHSPPAYAHMLILGGVVVAALVVLGVGWWRRRQRDRTQPPEKL
jgi:hypothetical protein